jgi:DNA-binding MarR family transcriptional regulator
MRREHLPDHGNDALCELFTDVPLQMPDQVAGFAIWRLSLAYQRYAESALRELGLTHTQFAILALCGWLNHMQQPVSHRDIAKVSGVQVAQVSLMIKALRAKRLVQQRMGAEDTRVRVVTLTHLGIELLAKAIPIMIELQMSLWPMGSELPAFLRIVHQTLDRWDTRNV